MNHLEFVAGIDPGKTGAIALLQLDGTLVDVVDMPDATGAALGACLHWILDDVAPFRVTRAFVERVGYMPGQRGGWTFAEGYGAILGALGALQVPVETISPAAWKKSQDARPPTGTSKELARRAGKDRSRQRAMELWPADADRFRLKKHDGRSDACLVARHGLNLTHPQPPKDPTNDNHHDH